MQRDSVLAEGLSMIADKNEERIFVQATCGELLDHLAEQLIAKDG